MTLNKIFNNFKNIKENMNIYKVKNQNLKK